MSSPSSFTEDDYSPSSTIITFPRPLPLLRRPHPAAAALAFPSPQSFTSAFISAESALLSQCESGARIGCSLRATSACAPPWWKSLFLRRNSAAEERERCEEREMEACFGAARDKCVVFAREKCLKGFEDARVVVRVTDQVPGRILVKECKGRDLLGSVN